MNPDNILYAPIHKAKSWRDLCQDIEDYIQNNRKSIRDLMPLARQRPDRALSLIDFMVANREHGQSEFWRVDYPNALVPIPFEFKGDVKMPTEALAYPAYFEIFNGRQLARSVEDANLIPNTYTHKYIFPSEPDALQGLLFLIRLYP